MHESRSWTISAIDVDDLARKVARKADDENVGSRPETAGFMPFSRFPRANPLVRKHRVFQGSHYSARRSD